MSLILPASYRANPLAEHLRTRDRADFQNGVALSAAMVETVERVAKGRRLSNKDLLRALCTAVASAVQAMAPEDDWQSVADILAEELRARLTVERVA